MSIDLFSYSDKGNRAINEDYYGTRNGGRCIAVLCDGLGGHESGEIASKFVTEMLVDAFSAMETVDSNSINNEVMRANINLIKRQAENSSWNGMRTTAVGYIIEGNKLRYFNSGDSRFYFFHNGILKYMTKDHSVSQMSVELGQMSFDDIRHDSDRSKLLKVLGDTTEGNICSVYKPITVEPGDAFLLCSDGFWEYILEDEMEIDLSKSEESRDWVQYMLVRLFCRMNGNNDNFTVVAGIVH